MIDLSEILYRPGLSTSPLCDFFCTHLGLDPSKMPLPEKRNHWVRDLPLTIPRGAGRYVLLCSQASTPLRSIPADAEKELVDMLHQEFKMDILGFTAIRRPHYTDIARLSTSVEDFIGWVKGASLVFSADSAAVHLAAAFGVPTLAGFTSIAPLNRILHYPHCIGIDLRHPETDGLHLTEDAQVGRVGPTPMESLAGWIRRRWRARCGNCPNRVTVVQ